MDAAGGGGYGDPTERDPERVSRDAIAGYITPGAAQTDYGVILDADTLAVDVAATLWQRSRNK